MDETKRIILMLLQSDPREHSNQERVAVRLQDAHSLYLQDKDGAKSMREILVWTRAWFNGQQVYRRFHDMVVQTFEYWHQFDREVARDPNCELPEMFVLQDPTPEPEQQLRPDDIRENIRAIRENLRDALRLMDDPGRDARLQDAREMVERTSMLVQALLRPAAARPRRQHSDELEQLMRQDECMF